MSCVACREAVSAGLDGEAPGLPRPWVEAHLAGCRSCRGWAEAAAEVTRRARLTAAPAVPDVTAAVLGRLPAGTPRPRRPWLDAGLRLALVAVGAGQLAVGLPVLAGGTPGMAPGMAAPVHLTHETGAWNLGLAGCFLAVAVLPRLAAGALPFLLPFSAVLAWVTVGDLRAGHVPAGRAGVHLLLLGGAVLVGVLALRNRVPGGGPAGASRWWAARTAARRGTGPAARGVGVAAEWPRDATARAAGDRAA